MRRNKFKKVMTVLIASAALATMGFSAVACGNKDGGHKHNWEPDWDSTSHWSVCKEDGEKKDIEPHVDENVKDGLCDVCGATMPEEQPTGVYTIELNANSGTLGSVTSVKTTNGKLASLPAAPIAPANKTFKGWYDAATGGTQVTTNTVFTANGTIYAQWEDSGNTDPTGVYTITLDANGGTLGSTTSVQTLAGKLALLPAAPTAPANKTFKGWYDAATDGTQITTATIFNSNTTIYAQWADVVETTGRNEYTVYLYAPDADGSVTVSVWGGMAGAFNDGAVMTAVADHSGWYSFKFKTDMEISDGANFNLYVADVRVATGYTTDSSWVYFVAGKIDVKWNSMAAAEAAYNEANNPGGDDVETETTTVYFHKPSDWEGDWVGVHAYYGAADTSATGNWGETKMTVDSGDWYKVDIELPEDTESFNIIIFDENDATGNEIRKSLNVTVGIGSNVYINAKGKAFTSKEAAEADEDDTIPKAYSYTFYMYAPDATSVTIGVWGNFAGEIADGTPMTAVAGRDGWYSYTLNTDIELKAGNGINLNIFVDGENKGKYSESDTDLYFIPVGGDRGFADFDVAKDKYDELTNVDPSQQFDLVIHFQKPSGWTESANIGAYCYGNLGELLGGWGATTMTADSNGWYSVSAKVNNSDIGTTFHIIVFDTANDTPNRFDVEVTVSADGIWISNAGSVTSNPNA